MMIGSAKPSVSMRRNLIAMGWTLFFLALAAVFYPVLFRGELPLYRDSGNFYFPLWYYLSQQYRKGILPAWDPYENLGAPLVANGTTAAFYPGILVFLLPLPYPVTYAAFLLMHVLLAAWGAARLARALGCPATSLPLASLVYALGGPTFFQIHNPVYLVGGAWLPWILTAIWRIVGSTQSIARSQPPPTEYGCTPAEYGCTPAESGCTFAESGCTPGESGCTPAESGCTPAESGPWNGGVRNEIERDRGIGSHPRWTAVGLLAFSTAMAALGGDPQTAYHAALIAFGTWVAMAASRVLRPLAKGQGCLSRLRPSAMSAGMLIVAFVLAFALAAVQILPSWHYAKLSDRTLIDEKDVSRLWANARGIETADARWADLRQSHADSVYAFSVPPWRLLELLWPDFGGAALPANERYLRAFAEEGRWWTPSLYLGFVPLVFALATARLFPPRQRPIGVLTRWHRPTRHGIQVSFAASGEDDAEAATAREGDVRGQVWLTWLAVVAVLASLGWYGLGVLGNALVEVMATGDGSRDVFYPPAGGIYWWLARLLPGYAMFRYPAKWLPFLAISVACLSAIGVERGKATLRRARRLAWIAVSLSVAALTVGVAVRWLGLWEGLRVPADVIFGPFRGDSALRHMLLSFSQTGVMGLIVAILSSKAVTGPRRASLLSRSGLPALMPRWRGIRLSLTLLWVIGSAVDLALAARPMVLSVRPQPLPSEILQTPPRRIWRPLFWYPPLWRYSTSPERLQELAAWERQTWFGRWGMLEGVANLQHYGTMMPTRYRIFLEFVKSNMGKRGGTDRLDEILPWLGAARLGEELLSRFPRSKDGSRGSERDAFEAGPAPAARIAYLVPSWHMDSGRLNLGASAATAADLWAEMGRWLGAADPPWRSGHCPTVEIPGAMPSLPGWKSFHDQPAIGDGPSVKQESLEIVGYSPGDVRIHVEVGQPSLLVLQEQYLPGWSVELRSIQGREKRTLVPGCVDRLLLGCPLPPGDWLVHWRYQQPGLGWGSWIAALAWTGMLAGVVWIMLRTPWSSRQRWFLG